MKCVCSWCKTVMRDGELPITNGICETCSAKELQDVPVIRESRNTFQPATGQKPPACAESVSSPTSCGTKAEKLAFSSGRVVGWDSISGAGRKAGASFAAAHPMRSDFAAGHSYSLCRNTNRSKSGPGANVMPDEIDETDERERDLDAEFGHPNRVRNADMRHLHCAGDGEATC